MAYSYRSWGLLETPETRRHGVIAHKRLGTWWVGPLALAAGRSPCPRLCTINGTILWLLPCGCRRMAPKTFPETRLGCLQTARQEYPGSCWEHVHTLTATQSKQLQAAGSRPWMHLLFNPGAPCVSTGVALSTGMAPNMEKAAWGPHRSEKWRPCRVPGRVQGLAKCYTCVWRTCAALHP